MRNQHHLQQLLTRKRNMRSKKLGSIENEVEEHSTSYIGRVMEMNITNGLWNWSCLMQKR